ncbi:transmembrane protein 45A-like [Canna indica]|uniref:Transmembrane protein 45A-like n=1 Tax=Canna indica TaxID=4628 RepID=A0AAQ3Q0M3_9LILI|nr:transmembrane protein 45A-like [Canna indica]
MGTLVGHVAPGVGFLVIGLWHLFNHIKLYSMKPSSYYAPPWFPTSKLRHLELYLVILGSLASISMELVIGPAAHQPFDADGTIPTNHLHNFEHASISLALLVYAAFAIALDRAQSRLRDEMTLLLAAAAFAQQLLIFHLHSADHMGVEGQYHWLLQAVIAVSLATTVAGVARPRSFAVSYVRSASIAFQGAWFVVMGCMLWTPGLIAKGCFMNPEDGHFVVRCRSDEALHRAKSLVNLQFSWCMTAMAVFSMLLYVLLSKVFPEEPQYLPLVKGESTEEEEEEVEFFPKSNKKLMESESFVHMGKGFEAIDLER